MRNHCFFCNVDLCVLCCRGIYNLGSNIKAMMDTCALDWTQQPTSRLAPSTASEALRLQRQKEELLAPDRLDILR